MSILPFVNNLVLVTMFQLKQINLLFADTEDARLWLRSKGSKVNIGFIRDFSINLTCVFNKPSIHITLFVHHLSTFDSGLSCLIDTTSLSQLKYKTNL